MNKQEKDIHDYAVSIQIYGETQIKLDSFVMESHSLSEKTRKINALSAALLKLMEEFK